MFCTKCGFKMPDNAGFCKQCGTPANSVSSPHAYQKLEQTTTEQPVFYSPVQPSPKKKKEGKLLNGFLIGTGIVTLVFIALGILGANLPTESINLTLGKAIELTSEEIPVAGGSLILEQADSSLDGLTLQVPEGAYPDALRFTLSETPIEEHAFGELFDPITPLITIDNGHSFAAQPMNLTIPIQLDQDEFAMGFYYNGEKGTLEGIPTAALDQQSITLSTCHFSDIVISKVKKSMLEGRIQNNEAASDFLPGMSDFYFPNMGSYAQTGGHCVGQSIAVLHYYNMNANDAYTGNTLRGEEAVDNNSGPATGGFIWDDALAYRLCSVLHQEYVNFWSPNYKSFDFDLPDDLTYYSFGYAIAMTHSPQLIDIKRQGGGHAMVVYAVTPDGLVIADPNYPGDLNRSIGATRLAPSTDPKGSLIDLTDYFSGAYAGAPGDSYGRFSYIGTYAYVNYDKVDALWSKVLQGQDVGSDLFIPDLEFVTLKWDVDGQKAVQVSLNGTYTLSKEDTAKINANQADKLFLSIPSGLTDTRIHLYKGTEYLGYLTDLDAGKDSWAVIPLSSGLNDIGVFYERVVPALNNGVYRYVNFYRLKVNLTEETPQTTEAPPEVTEGDSELTGETIADTTEAPAIEAEVGQPSADTNPQVALDEIRAAVEVYLGWLDGYRDWLDTERSYYLVEDSALLKTTSEETEKNYWVYVAGNMTREAMESTNDALWHTYYLRCWQLTLEREYRIMIEKIAKIEVDYQVQTSGLPASPDTANDNRITGYDIGSLSISQ